MNVKPTAREQKLLRVLDRRTEVDSISHLITALKGDRVDAPLEKTAIALDTSAFLRLPKLPRIADVLDYLSVTHRAPVIIPGQAIQEFWNNYTNVVDTVAVSLSKKFSDLRKDAERVDGIDSVHLAQIAESLAALSEEFGHVYSSNTNKQTTDMLEAFKIRAKVSYANRALFLELANHRKKTKTPPGFKDEGDGDFFVWLDALTGLIAQPRRSFEKFVFVTLDEKPDWSRNGTPHPVLSAEVDALFQCPFEIWKPDKLAEEVARSIDQT